MKSISLKEIWIEQIKMEQFDQVWSSKEVELTKEQHEWNKIEWMFQSWTLNLVHR